MNTHLDPLAQFQVKILAKLPPIFGFSIDFTNSALWMIVSVIAFIVFFSICGFRMNIRPSNRQIVAEGYYDFCLSMVDSAMGAKGRQFMPLVMSLFGFILFANLCGLIPHSLAVTSHIIINFCLACFVLLVVTVVGLYKNGLGFFRVFLPQGVPLVLKPLIVLIEVFTYLMRTVSLSMRLTANMIVGHTMVEIVALIGSKLPLFLTFVPITLACGMMAFEICVCFLQAYIFTLLTCVYMNDVIDINH